MKQIQLKAKDANSGDFVLDKVIFSKVFEKDIRRVFIYKKAERLAKALHLVSPAFSGSVSLKNRTDELALALVDAATTPPGTLISRELLTLSSILSIARAGGLLSHMNADLIAREAQTLLHEVASYEEPRLSLEEIPTLPRIAKNASAHDQRMSVPNRSATKAVTNQSQSSERKESSRTKGQIKDNEKVKDRIDTILSVIRSKQNASIKDISTLIRGVSEKTIQRELLALVREGAITKKGERRWSTYSIA